MTTTLPNAEDVNYWRTSRASVDSWLDKTTKLIADVGGDVTSRMSVMQGGRSGIVFGFEIGGENYRIAWPVLETKEGNRDDPAARVQAATFIYHDVKAKCMVAKVLGPRTAFIGNLLTGGGRTVAELSGPELTEHVPALLLEAK